MTVSQVVPGVNIHIQNADGAWCVVRTPEQVAAFVISAGDVPVEKVDLGFGNVGYKIPALREAVEASAAAKLYDAIQYGAD